MSALSPVPRLAGTAQPVKPSPFLPVSPAPPPLSPRRPLPSFCQSGQLFSGLPRGFFFLLFCGADPAASHPAFSHRQGGKLGHNRCRCQRDCALPLGLCTSSGLKTQTEAIRTGGLARTEQGDCLWAKFHSGGGKRCGPFFPR